MVKDPEMRTTISGISVAQFTLAVTRNYQEQNGEKQADFINCISWRKTAEIIAKYCRKGSQIAVDGRIQIDSYDAQDGSKRYTTKINVENVTLLGNKENNVSEQQGPVEEKEDITEIKDEDIPWLNGTTDEESDLPF